MSEFLRSDRELDLKLACCNDPSLVREIVKSHYAEKGIIRVERGNEYGMQFIQQPQSAESDKPLAASGYKFEHVFRYAPDSGRRALVLRANTEEDLRALIAQIERNG